ncbi:uncharacterized protein [Acropora muricata]|uniref:uncharacterized protein isoform X3 n=1 Tax=Acropora muricata TaxID=159855 RepID=UPI0034E3C723
MAAAKAILQELYFRSIDPLKYVLSHRYGWRCCSSVSSNGNQLQGDTREEKEEESPAGKMLDLVVSSLRVDRVLSSGLGMGRSKAGDLIAARHLYINQKICQKASLQVNEGDEIDITKSKENIVVELSQFKVLTIDKNHTKKNKRRLSGVRFARIFMLREEFDKKYKSSD